MKLDKGLPFRLPTPHQKTNGGFASVFSFKTNRKVPTPKEPVSRGRNRLWGKHWFSAELQGDSVDGAILCGKRRRWLIQPKGGGVEFVTIANKNLGWTTCIASVFSSKETKKHWGAILNNKKAMVFTQLQQLGGGVGRAASPFHVMEGPGGYGGQLRFF